VGKLLKTKIFRLLLVLLAPVLSGILMSLAFPRYDLGWFAWAALVPLFVVISDRSPGSAFLLSTITGLTFFPSIGHWLFELKGYNLLHHALWDLYLSLFFGLFGLAFGLISKRRGVTWALFAAPFLWVFVEYLRSNMGFMAFPWGLMAHSQYQTPAIIQIAALAGVYGLSFLIVMVNAALAAWIYPLFRSTLDNGRAPSKLARITWAAAAVLLTAGAVIYGQSVLSRPIAGQKIKVSVIQGNIEQRKKWDPKYGRFIMQTYTDLTGKAAAARPDLIVWPEAATQKFIGEDITLYSEVKRIGEMAGTYLLLGSSSRQKFKEEGVKRVELRNSAFLLSPKTGSKNQRYDKIGLLPFGEYLPYNGTIPWSWIDIPNTPNYSPGTEFTVFKCPNFQFGTTICWENIFADLVRRFVKNGAQFIVNITNEAWFGRTAAPYQFVSMSVFRAVENRVYVVRCANTGVSCFIDPQGRIVDRVAETDGRDLFVQGILTETVIPQDYKTIYTRYGDWFVWLCMGMALVFLLFAFVRRNQFSR
jgi:apolipoprotein N-acyltransferase